MTQSNSRTAYNITNSYQRKNAVKFKPLKKTVIQSAGLLPAFTEVLALSVEKLSAVRFVSLILITCHTLVMLDKQFTKNVVHAVMLRDY
ncbi:hypothetical protein GM612_08320 [Lactobacillus sp. CRM56-3]|uniref:Uncharacterized protein n=1 Tax=Secundilactobacillus folii TaxID=2678357 RepID=A0A7X3C2A8_9LACO|nr:hypothetical protein [Secundilactobacillus folii]